MVLPDAWMETALVSIAEQSGTDIKFHAVTETIDLDLGEKDIEGIALVNGGRITKIMPETDSTVTLEAYPVEVGSGDVSSATVGGGFFDLLHTEDTTQPYSVTNTRKRNPLRMAILWTDDTSVTNAAAAVATTTQTAMRFAAANGFITSVKPSFTDGILKFTITFKVAAFDTSGAGQIKLESVNSTASLTALASYTSTVKW